MNRRPLLSGLSVCGYTLLTVAIALAVGVILLNPLWARYSPPFPIPKILPAITAPVDGPFYLRNAEHGYRWDSRDPLSLSFHPMMSFLVGGMPGWFPSKIWFWCISVAFALGSIVFTYQLIHVYNEHISISARLLPLLLLAPGGLGIATGNAEIPTLFFTSALLLSVLRWQKWWLTGLFAMFAILTKPNALYIVPMLLVYIVSGLLKQDTQLWKQAMIGVGVLLLVWVAWMLVVDWKTGHFGSYWQSRTLFSQYAAHDLAGFFVELTRSFLYRNGIRDQVRYSTALLIPVVNLWIIGMASLSHESHRYAMAAGNVAMLIIALLLGNPNKVIVYTTTLPGYFPIYILMFRNLSIKNWPGNQVSQFIVSISYVVYCISMLIVYIFGTPLGWYY